MRIFKEMYMCNWCCVKLFTKVISLHDLDMVFRVIKGDFNGTDILDSDLKVVALDNLVTPWGVFFAIPDGWSKEVKYDLSSQIPHCLVDLIIPNDEGKKVVEDLSLISDEPSRELHGSHWFNWFHWRWKRNCR